MSNLYKILEVLMKSSRLEIKVTRDNEGTSVANMYNRLSWKSRIKVSSQSRRVSVGHFLNKNREVVTVHSKHILEKYS